MEKAFMVLAYRLEKGVPVRDCPVEAAILTETIPAFFGLDSSEPYQRLRQESSFHVPSDSTQ